MEKLSKEARAVLEAAGREPWTVYRCQFAERGEDGACGFNGDGLDASYDECHHTLGEAEAEAIVYAVNRAAGLEARLKQAREALRDTLRALECHLDDGAVAHGLKHRDSLCPCNQNEVPKARAVLAAMGGEG